MSLFEREEIQNTSLPTQSPLASKESFLLEVDRLFICASQGELGVSILQEFGLHCSHQIVQHLGQGIASTVLFFENAYIELIWVEDEKIAEQQARQPGLAPLSRTRWQQTGASPFGVGLRCQPIPTYFRRRRARKYRMECLLEEIPVRLAAENLANLEEPLCFLVPEALAFTNWLDRSLETHRQLISHPVGVKKLTGVKITVDSNQKLTHAVSLLQDNGVIAIERGTSPLLELTFDSGIAQKVFDTRPILPICLKY
jgi:hypothetical protein